MFSRVLYALLFSVIVHRRKAICISMHHMMTTGVIVTGLADTPKLFSQQRTVPGDLG